MGLEAALRRRRAHAAHAQTPRHDAAAGINLKKRWEDRRRAQGLPTAQPNLIISAAYQASGQLAGAVSPCLTSGAAPHARARPWLLDRTCAQVCWLKFSRYFDVELRLAHVDEGVYTLTPEVRCAPPFPRASVARAHAASSPALPRSLLPLLCPQAVERLADENTIGVVAILGSTYTVRASLASRLPH